MNSVICAEMGSVRLFRHHHRAARTMIAIWLLATSACVGREDRVSVSSAVFGNVSITSSQPAGSVSNLDIDTLPVLLRLGGIQPDPEDEFDAANAQLDGIELPNGSIALIDRHRVRVFDRQGRETHRIGRRGEGPQEFRGLDAICHLNGDTIVVQDAPNGRLAVVVLGTDSVVTTISQHGWTMTPHSCAEGATIILSKRAPLAPDSSLRRFISRLNPTLGNWDTLFTIGSPPFPEIEGGEITIAAVDDGILVTDPWENLLVKFGSKAETLGVRRAVISSTITESDRSQSASAANSGQASATRGDRPAGTVLYVPQFEWLEPDLNGATWVLLPLTSEGPSVWSCVDPSGVERLRMKLTRRPIDARVTFLGAVSSGLLVKSRDEAGAVVLRLVGHPNGCH